MTAPTRPKALTDLVALLDASGWSYTVQHMTASDGAHITAVKGRPHWDPYTEVHASWNNRNTGTLRLSSCLVRSPQQDWRDASLKTARTFIVPKEAGQ